MVQAKHHVYDQTVSERSEAVLHMLGIGCAVCTPAKKHPFGHAVVAHASNVPNPLEHAVTHVIINRLNPQRAGLGTMVNCLKKFKLVTGKKCYW